MGRRRAWWVAAGVAAVVLATACGDRGDGREEAGVARPTVKPPATAIATSTIPAPTIPTTTAPVAAVPEVARTGAATRRPAPTTTLASPAPAPAPTPAIEPPPGEVGHATPSVTVTPSRAAAGARVWLRGDGFVGNPWQRPTHRLWLMDQREVADCLVFARLEADVLLTADGHLSGSFVVPPQAQCTAGPGDLVDIAPARYYIAYQCGTCYIGHFTAILPGESADEPAGIECQGNVTFGVQDFASEIHVDGISCDEAQAFVRDHAQPWQPPTGPVHVDAGGFNCERVGQSSDALPPRANYLCERGLDSIWFVRQ